MHEENPYATPETNPILQPSLSEVAGLATPGERFLGALIDGLINIPIAILIWGGLFLIGVIGSWQDMGKIGISYSILISVLSFALVMAIQWKFLKATGQTIGKKVAKTRIVTMDGRKPEITDLIFKRYAFMSFIGLIPLVGGILSLVNVLLVFKSDRRCLHDMIAGTQVVKFPPGQIIS